MSDEITLKAVLDHIVAMEGRISTRIDNVQKELCSGFANLTRQIEAIDHRLDEIEIANLPKRVKVLEATLLC